MSNNHKMVVLPLYLDYNQKQLAWNILGSCMYTANMYIEHTKFRHDLGLYRLPYKEFHKVYTKHKNMSMEDINNMDDDWYKEFALGIKERSCHKDSKAVKDSLKRVSKSYDDVYEHNKTLDKDDKKAYVHYRSYKRNKRYSYYFVRDNKTDIDYIDYNHLKIPYLGIVKVLHIGNYIDKIPYIISGNVIIDHGKWYIAIRYKDNYCYHVDKNNYGLGIDYGIKTLLTISKVNINQTKAKYYKSINNYTKNKEYIKMVKRYTAIQRAISNKALVNYTKLLNDYMDKNNGNTPSEEEDKHLKSLSYRTIRVLKLQTKLHKQSMHIANYRQDKLYKIVNNIITKDRPMFIKIEDLKVKEMTSNKKLSTNEKTYNTHKSNKNLMEITPSMFKSHLINKGYDYHIPILLVDRYYPSTQTCSNCGYVLKGNEKLTKKDRVFKCPCCNYKEDRDINASINIALTNECTIAKKYKDKESA